MDPGGDIKVREGDLEVLACSCGGEMLVEREFWRP